MAEWLQRLVTPLAFVCSATTGWSVTYLTSEQAQQAIFPGATFEQADQTLDATQRKEIESRSGMKVRDSKLRAWKVQGGGWLLVDEVLGKHEFITYAVGLNSDGSVKQVEVMDYREVHGKEVRNEKWRAQFAGKTSRDKLKLDEDIRNVSGATLSCRHLTDGVRRLLATYELCLAKK